MFSQAQYEAVIDEIDGGTKTLQAKLAEVKPAAREATDHWWIDPMAAQVINWIADKTVEIGTAMLDWILDVLKGATAPIWMFIDAYKWADLRGAANGVSTDLSMQNLVIDDSDWSGKARESYLVVAGAQASAAARVGSIATTTSATLVGCATAGLLFYTAVAAVLVKLIAATVTAIAAFGSAVFSWAGAALVIEEAGFNTAVLGGAAATLGAFLAAQAAAMAVLHGDAVDPAGFPSGANGGSPAWPTSNTAQYSDATVNDEDADWSLQKD
ncbi:hypothetical protein [Actinoplanes derwentensis]|uniref:hypothetical protein n=1 Tax=Actinoplanes derwentensis TaxID=113562 RepID=UPI000B8827C0|nr:hypothetical protein [Actinoplanes derwentensis]